MVHNGHREKVSSWPAVNLQKRPVLAVNFNCHIRPVVHKKSSLESTADSEIRWPLFTFKYSRYAIKKSQKV